MKPSILTAAALVALGIAAQPADARMLTGLNLTTHTLRADTVMTLDHADSIHHMRKFNDDPPDDPDPKKTPKKTPTGSTGTGSGSDTGSTVIGSFHLFFESFKFPDSYIRQVSIFRFCCRLFI